VHGTTKEMPLERFDHAERAALRPLPPTAWELAEWKRAKLHADCHVVFDGAYYSGPHRLIGQRLWVRAAAAKVELFHDYTRCLALERPITRAGRLCSAGDISASTRETRAPPCCQLDRRVSTIDENRSFDRLRGRMAYSTRSQRCRGVFTDD